MKKEQLLFVPLVGKNLQPRKVVIRGSACRQKEGLKLIKNLPLLPRRTAVLPAQGREMKRGFTLLELLVVVLIIGILAAVALPQYQKAVAKSRFSTLKPIAKAIKQAQEFYYNEHGSYATSAELADLPIVVPSGVDKELSNTAKHEYISIGHDKLNNRYRIYFDHSENFAGNIYCEALTADDPLCIAEGGQTGGPKDGNYYLYLLAGNGTGQIVSLPTVTEGGTHFPQAYCEHASYGCYTYTYNDGTIVEVLGNSDYFDIYRTDEDGTQHTYYYPNHEGRGDDLSDFCANYEGIKNVGSFSCEDY